MSKVRLLAAAAVLTLSTVVVQAADSDPVVRAKMLAPSTAEDFYPAEAKRLLQEGVVVVHVCIDVDGRVSTSIKTSSGYPLLDDAAQRSLQNAKWQLATRDGRPVGSCKNLKVTYDLGPNVHQAQAEAAAAASKSEVPVPTPPGEPSK